MALVKEQLKLSSRFVKLREIWLENLSLVLEYTRFQSKFTDSGNKTLCLPINFSDELIQLLVKVSKKNELSMYIIIISALKCLIMRLTGNTQITILSPILQQSKTATTFAEYIPITSYINDNETFLEILKQVRTNTITAYKIQDYPVQEILESNKNAGSISNIICRFDNIHDSYIAKENEIEISFTYENSSLQGSILFNESYFEKPLIEKLAEYLTLQIEQSILKKDLPLDSIEILNHSNQLSILNGTMSLGKDQRLSVIEVIQETATNNREKIAAQYNEQSITYGTLIKKSNNLASVITNFGARENEVVGIFVENSIDLIICIVASLKCGVCFLPLDTSTPIGRMRKIVKDSSCRLILTVTDDLADKNIDCKIVNVSKLNLNADNKATSPILKDNNRNAYVIYTSGTTGFPKGVVIGQNSLLNYLRWFSETVNFTKNDSMITTSSHAFDMAITTLLVPIINGGCIHFQTKDDYTNTDKFITYIKNEKISIIKMTPSLLSAYLCSDALDRKALKHLNFLVLGGEKIDYYDVQKILELNSNLQVLDEYGPTESTVGCIAKIINSSNINTIKKDPSIGQPITNMKVCVSSKLNKNLPCGCEGELLISGEGLSKGYLNRVELTHKTFVNINGEIWYKTGDRGLVISTLEICYIGREDDQIKINGFRVEVAEIEKEIISFNHIKNARVIQRKVLNRSDKVLCAYVISDEKINLKELQDFLISKLPKYMVPLYFEQINQLPLTLNGKLDIIKLSLPKLDNYIEFESPKDYIENTILEIWSEVLNLEKNKISTLVNFFEIGGNSLKAIILLGRMHKTLNCQIELSKLYNSPTIKGLAEICRGDSSKIFKKINTSEKREYYQLTSAQKRLFVIQHLNPNNLAYNVFSATNIEGKLNIDKLQYAVNKIVMRHEVLRTSIKMVKDTPFQFIEPFTKNNVVKITELQHTDSLQKTIENFKQPFDLSKPPFIRIGIIKQSESNFILLIDMHHIISDGISFQIFLHELIDFYSDKLVDTGVKQYKDYAQWQNSFWVKESLKTQKKYWVDKFSKNIPLINLSFDFPLGDSNDNKSKNLKFEFDQEISSKIKSFFQKEGSSAFAFFFAVYHVMLSKISDQDILTIGIPIAGRHHTDLENIMGMFVNSLPIKIEIKTEARFSEYFQTIKTELVKDFENQLFQFDELVENVVAERDPRRNPIFDVEFAYHNHITGIIKCDELEFEQIESTNNSTKFILTLHGFEHNNIFSFSLGYNANLFKPETINSFKNYFINICNQILANPDITVKNLTLLSIEEKSLLSKNLRINKSNDYPVSQNLVKLFENSVLKNSDKIAIVFKDKTMTFNELNKRVNQIANKIISLGIHTQSNVALNVERTDDMLVLLLAVIKAGCFYVPLNLSYPVERIKRIIKDCSSSLLITDNENFQSYYENVNLEIKILSKSNLFENLHEYSSENPTVEINPDFYSYCIFTSGSTGNAKGILIRHYNVINLIYSLNEVIYQQYGKDVNFALLSPFEFDASIQHIFAPLLFGNKLFIILEKERVNGNAIYRFLNKYQIDVSDGTPSHLYLLHESIKIKGHSPKTKHFLIAGEVLPKSLIEEFYNIEGNKNIKITNLYGPTETCVDSSFYHINKDELNIMGSIPIGKALTNQYIYILSKNNQLCPINIEGEIGIGGSGVGGGYVNNPELTSSMFIKNPLNDSEVIYKTGDRGKLLSDYNIEFNGRNDSQIKIRGHRIDLKEIESRIISYPRIEKVIVLAVGNKIEDKSLTAYLISKSEINVHKIKAFLSELLPSYMVPPYIIQLKEFPMLPNGKVNRKELEKINLNKPDIISDEKLTIKQLGVVEVIASVLKINIEHISLDNDFFVLGGNSLRAIKLSTLIKQNFGVDLSIIEIFKNSTIENIVKKVLDQNASESLSIPKIPELEEYELSSSQKRIFVLQKLNIDLTAYNMPQLFKLKGELDIIHLENCINKLTEIHQGLKTYFVTKDGIPLQKICKNIDFKLEVISNIVLNVDDISRYIKPFNLSKVPLFRFILFNVGNKELFLLFDIHHIISDGISNELIVSHLLTLYNNQVVKSPAINYIDYSYWLNSETSYKSKQLKYWKNELQEPYNAPELSVENKRPRYRNYEGGSLSVYLGEGLLNSIYKQCANLNVTLNMFLLSAYYILISKLSNVDDLIIGTPIAGRNVYGLDNVIGNFLNTLPIRCKLNADTSFENFLQYVKLKVTAALDNQDIPFEELLEKLKIPREHNKNPLFDIVFILQNMEKNSDEQLRQLSEKINIIPVQIKSKTSKFDLMLVGAETNSDLILTFEYYSKIFSQDRIQKVADYYLKILNLVVENSNVLLKDIGIISTNEERKILEDFNNTDATFDENLTILDYFKENVSLHSHKIALRYGSNALTYKELDRRSDSIAHYLFSNGVKENAIVAVLMNRNIDLIITLFGIIKTGTAYLPIDTDVPIKRLGILLNDSQAKILITDKNINSLKTNNLTINIVQYSTIPHTLKPYKIKAKSNDAMYVIYTSGSTGLPKGVIIKHQSLVNRLNWMKNDLEITEKDEFILKTPYTFDVSVWELFLWCIKGASLSILTDKTERLPESIISEIKKNNISVIHFVPSMLGGFLTYLSQVANTKLKSLRNVISSGEVLTKSHVERFYNCFSKENCKLYNYYGPTEATIDVTSYYCQDIKPDSVPIGKPIDNTKIFITDKNLNLIPIGVSGELLISGTGLAIGYLNNVELTHEKFIDNGVNNERIYKTGDLAKYNTDGNIEYIGRKDFQVKIRGVRIDIKEIEYYLNRFPQIQEAIVITIDDSDLQKQLVGFYISKTEIDIAEIKKFLSEHLIPIMIPNLYKRIEKIPYTSNGKLNTKELSYSFESDRSLNVAMQEPVNENQWLIFNIWKEILGHANFGITDSFFSIGGDSIKVIQSIAKFTHQGLYIDMKDFYDLQTIERIAQNLNVNQKSISQVPIFGEVPLLPIQEYFFNNLNNCHFNHSIMLESDKKLSPGMVKSIFNKLIQHHDMLRAIYIQSGNNVKQVVKESVELNLYESNFENTKQVTDASNKIQSSINLENGPLIKLGLFHVNNKSYLLLVIHHLVVDGVSWRILLEDMETSYQQITNEKETILPLKTNSYLEWSESLIQYQYSEKYAKAEQYWKRIELANVNYVKTDYIADNLVKDEFVVQFEIADFGKWEKSLMQISINEAIIAGLAKTLADLFQLELFRIELEGHGRESINRNLNVSRTVGWFTIIYPLLIDYTLCNNTTELLCEIKNLMNNLPDSGIGYGIFKQKNSGNHKETEGLNKILLNYLGEFSQSSFKSALKVSGISGGQKINPLLKKDNVLELSVVKSRDNILVSIVYSNKQFKEETIREFKDQFIKNLTEINSLLSKELLLSNNQQSFDELTNDELEKILNN